MKRTLIVFLCFLLCLTFTACKEDKETEEQTNTIKTASSDNVAAESLEKAEALPIAGTWVCDDINKDCYFIFEENGDAFAKWGTSTVYGYYDYNSQEELYDIDVPNFLYNEYKASFSDDTMTLKSETSKYTFEKTTMPEITIKAPDNLRFDDKLLGNWQCADNYECYEFRDDNTATITDLYNYATIECKFSCDNGVITFYYMSSATKDGSRESEYSFDGEKLKLGTYIYENVTGMTS